MLVRASTSHSGKRVQNRALQHQNLQGPKHHLEIRLPFGLFAYDQEAFCNLQSCPVLAFHRSRGDQVAELVRRRGLQEAAAQALRQRRDRGLGRQGALRRHLWRQFPCRKARNGSCEHLRTSPAGLG